MQRQLSSPCHAAAAAAAVQVVVVVVVVVVYLNDNQHWSILTIFTNQPTSIPFRVLHTTLTVDL